MITHSKEVTQRTDKYFSNVRSVVNNFGDVEVTYAVFVKVKVVAALEPMINIIHTHYPEAKIKRFYNEGDIVPAGEKLAEITGSFGKLSELETLCLQKTGFPCVTAYNAYKMTLALPDSKFMDMHARHGLGDEMSELAAYGAVVGTKAAQNENSNVKGFIGTSQDLTAHYFGASEGMGTVPHALIGYAGGDIVQAMNMFAESCPRTNGMIALVDYNGQEITDSLKAASWFDWMVKNSNKTWSKDKFFGVRLDTHGSRFAEELDYNKSVEILEDWTGVKGEFNIVAHAMGQRAFTLDENDVIVDRVRKVLFGKGVSAANIINTRQRLNEKGFEKAHIVASSGFDTFKCEVMGSINAPIDMVGTGSFLPKVLNDTHATADVISYNGVKRVKVGREYLLNN